jgi:hypothetical protein
MKLQLQLGALAAAAVLAAGCASIVKGTTQTITVSSNVDGADVYLDGLKVGTTPFAGPVPKSKATLMVQKAGYKTVSVSLSTSLEPIFWGNIITGGTLGSLTDFASGAAYQYAPASYQVDLKPEGQASNGFERRAAARKFAMVHVDRIAADLAHGSGEHLAALLTLVNAGQAAATAADVRQALVASEADPVRFGNRIVDLI